jgi:hypothetical protein
MKEILSEIVILNTRITLWSGRKRLREEDLQLAAGSRLPPADLASLGSKKVMDPAALAPFERLKRQAEREILAVGTRFLSGYAVPKTRIKALLARLAEIEEAFAAARQQFLAEYDQAVEGWIAANPGWEELIRRSVEEAGYVGRQLSFAVQTFTIAPYRGQRQGLEKEVSGLAGQLRQEVAQMARSSWEDSFTGRTEVGQRAVRPLRAMLEKVEGLVFLEPGLGELVRGIRGLLDALPATGPIKGADFAAVCGCLQLLGDIPEAGALAADPPEAELEPAEPADFPERQPPLPFPAPPRGAPFPVPSQWF